MKRILLLVAALGLALCALGQNPAASGGVQVGMADTAAYFPRLEGKRVALLCNRTSVAEMPGVPGAGPEGRVHLVDLLHRRGFDIMGIFSPEHGFRGTADAGEAVDDSVDPETQIPILSLYDGRAHRPSDEVVRGFDVLVVDLQDVGLRFYTYYISMLRMAEVCGEFGREVIVLDRPNPNGRHIDGPILDMKYKSGVGILPVPVLHGLTMGEIALMAKGEGWVRSFPLTVVACRNYTHATEYALPVPPSPNLPTMRSVYLYPSLCLFEGTVLSVGRGTPRPFECFGHPRLKADDGYTALFTPTPRAGAVHPLLEGQVCRGMDLSGMECDEARDLGLTLRYLIRAFRDMGVGDRFFTPMFEKLIGAGYVREMILRGADEEEIRARWQADLERYRRLRAGYLIYAD